MKFYVLFIVFLLSIYGCSDSKRSNTVSTTMLNDCEISVSFLNKLKGDTVTIPLSSLVEECELVQLEYKEEALFKPFVTIVTNNYIGVRQEMGSYKLFSRSGKFLCSVGSVGQGPGEYFVVGDDIIDEKNELIYLAPFLDGNKILVYNTLGEFLKNIEMPQPIVNPKIFLSDDTLTVVYIADTDDKSILTQINIHTGQVVNEFTTQIPQKNNHIFYNSRNMWETFDISHASYDTLYHLDRSNYYSIKPIFVMSHNLLEVLVLHNQLNKDLVLTTITRRGLVATDMKNKKSSWVRIKNDYFGNLNVQIDIESSFRNGYFVYNIQPEQLMDDIEQYLTESDCTEKDRQILQKTLSTLKEDTNNVVFIGKLKNEVQAKLF